MKLYEKHPAVVDEIGYGIVSCMPVRSTKTGQQRKQPIVIINLEINYFS